MAARIVAARNIRLHTDSRLQRSRRKAIARIGRKCPRPYAVRTETAELPDSFIIEIPTRLLRRLRTPEPCSQAVPGLLPCSAIVCERFPVQPQVVAIERHSTTPRTRRIYSPECGAVIGHVIEETRFV